MTGYDASLESEIQFSKLIPSSRHKHIAYVYPQVNSEKIYIHTPKVVIQKHRCTGDDTKSAIDINLNDSKSMSTAEFEHFKDSLKSITATCVNFLKSNNYSFSDDDVNLLTFHIRQAGKKSTTFYSTKQRTEIKDFKTINSRNSNSELTGKSCKIIAELAGITLNSESQTARFVWNADQILIFDQSSANPFGQKYEFIEDDGYASLED